MLFGVCSLTPQRGRKGPLFFFPGPQAKEKNFWDFFFGAKRGPGGIKGETESPKGDFLPIGSDISIFKGDCHEGELPKINGGRGN